MVLRLFSFMTDSFSCSLLVTDLISPPLAELGYRRLFLDQTSISRGGISCWIQCSMHCQHYMPTCTVKKCTAANLKNAGETPRTPMRMFWLCGTFYILVSIQSVCVAGATVPSTWRLYRRLKLLTVGASLTSSGRLFHCSMTLELKKFLLNS